LGIIYMLQFKELKKKHLGYFYNRLPPLTTLDAMNLRSMTIGWVFLTLGVVVGIIWASQARASAPNDPNLAAMGLNDPKILFAIITWMIYSFALLSRRAMGW